jgi:hypothetical protein
MAIVLTLKPKQDVFVGDTQMVLKDIESPTKAVIAYEGKEFTVGPDDWVTMMDGCEVRLGRPREHWTAESRKEVRLQFEAPGQLVLRGSSYRNKRKEAQ